jgi:hypothetical protein
MHIGFWTIFSRTKNENSRIWNDWCKNITFQLPIAKVIEASTTLSCRIVTFKKWPSTYAIHFWKIKDARTKIKNGKN